MWNEFKRQVFGCKPKKKNYAERNKGKREAQDKRDKATIARIKKQFDL